MNQQIPFNRATIAPKQMEYLHAAMKSGSVAGNGPFSAQCEQFLQNLHESSRVLLTSSCTSALEMAALLLDLRPGDEVIVPSYTFVSTANAFVIHGAHISFCDINPLTLCLDVDTVKHVINEKTRAVVTVNYGGYPSATPELAALCEENNCVLIEDNAHGLFSFKDGTQIGTQSSLSTLSFHETKNISCGEGGALIVNDQRYLDRAEIIREKGTDRSKFFRGLVDKYTWLDKGSSYLMSDFSAAILLSQLEHSQYIQSQRRSATQQYLEYLREWALNWGFRMAIDQVLCDGPFHMFPLIMPDEKTRNQLLNHLHNQSITATFHYVPLHNSPAGLKFGTSKDGCINSENISRQLIRLPLFSDIKDKEIDKVIEMTLKFKR